MILVYKLNAEIAKQILDFFGEHPERQECFVAVDKRKGQVEYTRDDIPKLQSIIIGEDIFASVK